MADCLVTWITYPRQPEPRLPHHDFENFGRLSAFPVMTERTPSDKVGRPWLRPLLIVVFILIVILIALLLGIYFGTAPHPKLQVQAVSVCPFSISRSQITAKWDFDLLVRNPYHNSFYYSLFDLSLFYENEILSGASVGPFVQNKKNQTEVHVSFVASSVYVGERAMKDIIFERSGGVVNFDLKIKLNIWTRRWSGMENMKMDVMCKNLMVGFPSNNMAGNLLGGATKCKVKRQ